MTETVEIDYYEKTNIRRLSEIPLKNNIMV